MAKNLSNFDILGLNPTLYSNSCKRKKTIFGGIMSIFTVIICITGIIYFFLEVLLRSSYVVIYNQSTDLNPVLNITKMPFAFNIVDGEGRYIKNFDNQIRIFAEYMRIYPDKISNEIVEIKRELIKLEKCNIDDFGEYRALYKNFSKINQLFCLPINKLNLTVYGTFADANNPNSAINIRITKCFNDPNNKDLFPPIECYNRTVIDKNLANIFFSSVNPDYDIDHSDPNNPGKLILRTETLQLTSTIFNRYYMYKRIINYVSDFGFLVSNSVKQQYFQQDVITQMTDLRVNSDPSGIFGLITLTLSKKTDFYTRNYIKLQTALANIGGIVEGIFFIFSLFVKLVMKRNYFNDLGRLTYRVYQENEKETKYKIINESINSQNEIPVKIKKNIEFKMGNQTFNEVGSNINIKRQNKSFSRNIKNSEVNKDLDSKNIYYKNDFMRIDHNNLTSNQKILSRKDELKENNEKGVFDSIFSHRKGGNYISRKLEKIIKTDLSVEKLLKILNLVEIIERDLVNKKIIEKNNKSTINDKIQGIYNNQNPDKNINLFKDK